MSRDDEGIDAILEFDDRAARVAGARGPVQLILLEILNAIRAAALGVKGANASATRTLYATQTGTKLKCLANFGRPTPFTVHADISLPGVQAQMLVESRLDGSIIQRVYDVAAGLTVGGIGESVSVTLSDNTTLGDYARPVAAFGYTAVVTISPGARPTGTVPPVQTGAVLQAIGAGASVAFPVPAGATGVLVYGTAGGGPASLYVDHYTAGTIGGFAVKINSTPGSTPGAAPVPLISGVGQVNVTNEGAGGANVTVVWSMDG